MSKFVWYLNLDSAWIEYRWQWIVMTIKQAIFLLGLRSWYTRLYHIHDTLRRKLYYKISKWAQFHSFLTSLLFSFFIVSLTSNFLSPLLILLPLIYLYPIVSYLKIFLLQFFLSSKLTTFVEIKLATCIEINEWRKQMMEIRITSIVN